MGMRVRALGVEGGELNLQTCRSQSEGILLMSELKKDSKVDCGHQRSAKRGRVSGDRRSVCGHARSEAL